MRVIAGRLGGRRLLAPPGRETRPTSDRVREALFAMLGDVTGAVVLDLYAGTGALGIEALSRGAARAVFVERARPALEVLRRNVAALDLARLATIIAASVGRAVDEVARRGPFDVVFADPPYAVVTSATGAPVPSRPGRSTRRRRGAGSDDDITSVFERLGRAGSFGPAARIVVEHASRDAAPEMPGLAKEATRTYGDTALTFYACGSPPNNFPSPEPKVTL